MKPPICLQSQKVKEITFERLPEYVKQLFSSDESIVWWGENERFWYKDWQVKYEDMTLRLEFPLIKLFERPIIDASLREQVLLRRLSSVLSSHRGKILRLSLLSHTPLLSLFHLSVMKAATKPPDFAALALVGDRAAIPIPLICSAADRDVGDLPQVEGYRLVKEVLLPADRTCSYEPALSLLDFLYFEKVTPRDEGILRGWLNLFENPQNQVYEFRLPAWLVDEARYQKLLLGEVDAKSLLSIDMGRVFAPICEASDITPGGVLL